MRSSWLMLARNSLLYSLNRALQLLRSGGQHHLRSGEFFLLMREQLSLFLELGIDLLELRLLHLEAGLRLAQRTSLLLELLVADPQFLGACLQFFRLLLGFLQQFLETLTILGGTHRNRNGLRRP